MKNKAKEEMDFQEVMTKNLIFCATLINYRHQNKNLSKDELEEIFLVFNLVKTVSKDIKKYLMVYSKI